MFSILAVDGACLPTLAKVFAHALFYCTGVGVTILLMNLLVGVLGQNFELYQDRSVILFQRARAKMLMEFQSRPWKHLLRRLFRLFGWMMLDQKEVDSEEEVSCFRLLIFLFAFGPIVILLRASSAEELAESIDTTLGRLTRSGWVVLLLFSPVFFSVSTCLAVILLFLRVVLQMQLGGIFYLLAVALGYLGEDGKRRAEECRIWIVLREDASMDETRSLRSAMKAELEMVTTNLARCFGAGIFFLVVLHGSSFVFVDFVGDTTEAYFRAFQCTEPRFHKVSDLVANLTGKSLHKVTIVFPFPLFHQIDLGISIYP